jgi:uncharacterized Fe-S center protein
MTESSSKLTRRRFLLAGSAAVAAPLVLNGAGFIGNAAAAEGKIAKGTKIYFITKGCVGCQTCRTFCPAKAIHFGDTGNEIDQSKCKHCGTCYRECPISVITETLVS